MTKPEINEHEHPHDICDEKFVKTKSILGTLPWVVGILITVGAGAIAFGYNAKERITVLEKSSMVLEKSSTQTETQITAIKADQIEISKTINSKLDLLLEQRRRGL